MLEYIFSEAVAAFFRVMRWDVIFMIFLGDAIGMVIGALPGLTATMGMALFVPMTFFMNPILGIPFLIGLYKGGTYGGSVSAILIGTPGTAASAATILDGFQMSQKGEAGRALKMAIYTSSIADFIANVVLVTSAIPLSWVALKFGEPELFAVILFSMTMVSYVSGKYLIRGISAALLGVFLSIIGLDPVDGGERFNFGLFDLRAGFHPIPLAIGLFAISEVLIQLEKTPKEEADLVRTMSMGNDRLPLREVFLHIKTIVRSSLIGAFIGALPGIGSETSCWVAYGLEKRSSKNPEKLGTGVLEGVAAPEAANNAVVPAAFIPMLTFGIPGDIVTAILIGAFIAQGLSPGPTLIPENPEIIYALFMSMFVATTIMFLTAMATVKIWVKVLKIPQRILYPIVVVLSVAGSYAINTSMFDVGTMFMFGFMGYLLRKTDFPIPPVMLAFVLTPMLEPHLRQALLLSRGSPLIFITHPISATFLILTVGVVLQVAVREVAQRRKEKRAGEASALS